MSDEFSIRSATNTQKFEIRNLFSHLKPPANNQPEIECSDSCLLDDVLRDGRSKIIDICGTPGSNRSLISLKACFDVLANGNAVLYIDTRNVINLNRIREFYNTYKDRYWRTMDEDGYLNRIYYKYILSDGEFEEFLASRSLKKILEQNKNIKLVVIDDLNGPLRGLELRKRTALIRRFLQTVQEIISCNCVQFVIASCMVHEIGSGQMFVPALKDSYSHRVSHRFVFDCESKRFEALK